jgi:hypothetical protein
MTATETPVRTLVEIEAELAKARLAVSAAEIEEAAAFARVTASREGLALGQIARKALLVFQGSLALSTEKTEQAKARVRALDRLAVQHREAEAAAQRTAEAERSRRLRADGIALAVRTAGLLEEIERVLLRCSEAIADYHAEEGSYSPNTTFGRERAWAAAAAALRQLRVMYPAPPAVKIQPNPVNEEQ